jgi:DNA-binding Lrp family transcriptional regulator
VLVEWPAMNDESATDRAILRVPDVQRASAGLTFVDNGTGLSSPAALDDVDKALVTHLLADGKTTNRELAQRIGVSESVVSMRLRKMTASGLLVFAAIIDWEAAGFDWFVICRIRTRARSPREVAQDISAFPQSDAVAVCVGSYDVLAYFLVPDLAELRDVTNQLATIDGVCDLDVDLAIETTVPQYGRQLFLSRNAPPIRLPAPRIDLDEIDIAVMQQLIDDGRQSSRNIARRLNVSEGTVRARVNRLIQSGLIRVVAMVEPVALGLIGVIASISIRADRAQLKNIHHELGAVPNVVFTAVCLGSWDLHVTVTATTAYQLMQIVGTIQAIDGVTATDAMLMTDVLRLSSYMKRLDAA